ncbi:MAG TPA: cytochrome c3 family protein [Spirochaetota bacterium]|nr:cytochrome c3 family protein [Spirochaetota bacterium]HNT11804.1 cytochrome c3 family protein [Spirochaetota bacterium]HPU88823.1 cytochrome c3 family protein [Spirochaetota bacterium]
MKRTLILIFLPFLVVLPFSYVISEKACGSLMSFHAKKPIPFNHKSHITKYGAANCETCHGYYENGRFKGLPTVGECKACHTDNDAGKTPEQARSKPFFANYKDGDRPWEAFAKQPDLVYFSHMAVMKNEKQARCSSCHGLKEDSMTTAKIKGKMPMGQCMDCHTALKISNACMVCHD